MTELPKEKNPTLEEGEPVDYSTEVESSAPAESSASETVSVSTPSSGKEDPPGSSRTSRRSDGSEGLVEESLPSREELNQGLNTLQRRVCALSEPRGQMDAAARCLFQMGSSLAAEVLNELHMGFRSDGGREAYMGVARLLMGEKELPYHMKQPLYTVARNRGYLSVAYSILRPPAHRKRGAGECMVPDPPESDRTLGERKARARSRDRFILDRVVRDPDPTVVANVLQNPKLRERDVVRIAATRPVQSAVLLQLARHRKWMTARLVQVALVSNPFTPPFVALALLPLLDTREISRLASENNLHLLVREAAAYIHEERMKGKRRMKP